MPEMSFDVEQFTDLLAEYVSTEPKVFGGVTHVSDVDENMRSGGSFFDFTAPDGHTYTVEVSEQGRAP